MTNSCEIDLSRAAAEAIDPIRPGVAEVAKEIIGGRQHAPWFPAARNRPAVGNCDGSRRMTQ